MNYYDEITALFKNQYGYVLDIESVEQFLISNGVSEEEISQILLKINEDNAKLHDKLKIRPRMEYETKKEKPVHKEEERSVPEPKPEIPEKILDVKEYVNLIRSVEDKDLIPEILPSIYDVHYDEIISLILIRLYQEVNEITEIILEANSNEDKELFKQERNDLRDKIEIVKTYIKEEEEKEEEENQEDNKEEHPIRIIYAKRNDEMLIDKDLDLIDSDDYKPAKDLIEKVQKGKLYNSRRYKCDQRLQGLEYIRIRDSRLLYVKIDDENILLVALITKRCQMPKQYINFLVNRYEEVKEGFEGIKKECKEGTYKEECDAKTKEVLDTLSGKVKTYE